MNIEDFRKLEKSNGRNWSEEDFKILVAEENWITLNHEPRLYLLGTQHNSNGLYFNIKVLEMLKRKEEILTFRVDCKEGPYGNIYWDLYANRKVDLNNYVHWSLKELKNF